MPQGFCGEPVSALEQTPERVRFDPLLNKSYQATRLGRSVVDFLAWMKTGKAAERTLDQYERDLSRACLMFPETTLEEFSTSELLHVAASFPPKGRRVRVAAYRSFFRWALQQGLIERNPADRLPDIKREPQQFIDTFSDEEIAVLTDLPLRDGALMQLLFDAGLRKGEARRFRFAHFRPEPSPGQVVVLKGKAGKDRVLPATLAVSTRLNELALTEGLSLSDHLWYTQRANASASKTLRVTPLGEGSFDRWWRRCLDQAGVRYRNPHTARHTFATRYLRLGGSLPLLSAAMGHASIKTTYDLYAHLDQNDLAAEFARLFPIGADTSQ